MQKSRDISRLIEIMAALRTPETGCPWDLEQTFATIAPYTIEEAFEVADAIAHGDREDLREELGDLLFVVVNLAKWLGIDAESALREANLKFSRRFRALEKLAESRQISLAELGLDDLEALWQEVKVHLKE